MSEPSAATTSRPSVASVAAAGFLRIFTVIRPEETAKALLLTLNSFLIIFGYYQIKAVREGLLLAAHPASVKSYLAIPQAFLLIFVVMAFSRVSSKVPRHILITWVSMFCASNLLAFILLDLAGVSVSIIGIAFFIWIGMYNQLIPAQFWGFANDIYDEAQGKRLFPLIALGASLGGVVGPLTARQLIPVLGSYGMMGLTAALLVPTVLLTWEIHRLDLREHEWRTGGAPTAKDGPAQTEGRIPADLSKPIPAPDRLDDRPLQFHQRPRRIHVFRTSSRRSPCASWGRRPPAGRSFRPTSASPSPDTNRSGTSSGSRSSCFSSPGSSAGWAWPGPFFFFPSSPSAVMATPPSGLRSC